MKTVVAALFLTFGFVSSASADDTRDAYDRGVAAQRRGDNAAALTEYRFAAERADANAQGKLGIMCMYGGRGIAQDFVQAHLWLSLAAANASPGSEKAAAVTNGMMVKGRMSAAQIAEAQKLAVAWAETHATQTP